MSDEAFFLTDNSIKQLVAAWRVLVGVWIGSSAEMSLNQFLDSVAAFAPNPPQTAGLPPGKEKEKYIRPTKVPSRTLVRHVLRMRVQATRELAQTFLELEDADATVKASFWLAETYGGDVLPVDSSDDVPVYERHWPQGTRQAREIVAFLRGRGARLEAAAAVEEYWAEATSGEE